MRIAIIGAGAAGCAAAYRLHRDGHEVIVFERDSHVGGRTTSWRQDGWTVDSGAGFFTNFYPTLHRLVDELGLRGAMQPIPRSTALVHHGVIGSLTIGSVGSFVGYPFASAAAKLRMARATVAAALRYRRLDLARPATLAALDDRSVHDDARVRVGEEAYQFLVRPGIEPFWYFSCDDVSRALSLALMARAATARFYTLREGMDSVCSRLVAGIEVRLGAAVDRVERQADRFVVHAGAASERFDALVVATTATVAARLVGDLPDITRELHQFLQTQRYVGNIHAAFVTPPLPELGGRSSLFPVGPEPQAVAAIGFNRAKGQSPPRGTDEIVSVFLTAHESRNIATFDDAAVFAHAWTLARRLVAALPVDARPFRLIRREEAIPLHAVGRYRQAAAVAAAQRGPIVFAGDYLTTATVDGALTSGFDAAETLARTAAAK